jgi:hypothetical protein
MENKMDSETIKLQENLNLLHSECMESVENEKAISKILGEGVGKLDTNSLLFSSNRQLINIFSLLLKMEHMLCMLTSTQIVSNDELIKGINHPEWEVIEHFEKQNEPPIISTSGSTEGIELLLTKILEELRKK